MPTKIPRTIAANHGMKSPRYPTVFRQKQTVAKPGSDDGVDGPQYALRNRFAQCQDHFLDSEEYQESRDNSSRILFDVARHNPQPMGSGHHGSG
jgi:hypothetical protein